MTHEVDRMLDEIRQLAPSIASRAAEIEAARRMPADLVETLKAIGIYRMFVPRSHGGMELDLPQGLRVIVELAKIDGSVGWTAMIAGGSALIASLLNIQTYDQVYESGPDVILGGSSQPGGTAQPAPGGWRVSGRWPFASGCQQAEWMVGFCVMTKDGKPFPGYAGEDGPPLVRGFILPASEWQIEDTWHVAGLKGSGSHHIAIADKIVPESNFFHIEGGVPCLPGPLYQSVLELIPVMHSAFSVGVAKGALEELVAFANTGRRQLRAVTAMRDSELFQAELGRVGADLRAAQAFMEAQATSHWGHALAGTINDAALRMQSTQNAVWIASTCVRIADACFALGGGSALYNASPLQRRLRDLHAGAQHVVAQQRNYAAVGKLLLENRVSKTPASRAARSERQPRRRVISLNAS
ncbi:MAG TPA: acyl-CoA dehydrogenase family protein [Paraburkholderia sp.]|uniref:acyl-CoA dehydrogenase family protein n=1 Tax=Paraburkholderia sp. TaxID=1926495 RepID=UPI002B4A847C|nr:acyl-CoA dehydrogenase family protein [Paraburkholderia sp.]HKR47239.1 acyl-CoA dehydrogenase family protein [Paraburkholderia sp.]